MNTSERSHSLSRKEDRLAVDRALGLSLLACVSGLLLRCRFLHCLGGAFFLGCVGLHLAQHEEWFRSLLAGSESSERPLKGDLDNADPQRK